MREALDECVLKDLFSEGAIANAPLDECEELAVARHERGETLGCQRLAHDRLAVIAGGLRLVVTKTKLTVNGMSCGCCRGRVKAALALDGVATVDVQLEQRTVEIEHEPHVRTALMIEALQRAGYEARL